MRRLLSLLVLLVALLTTVAPVLACDGTHIVQPGDTLYSIARRYGLDVWTLANANGIVNPHHIYVGQRLTIPGSCPAPAPAPSPSDRVHVVQRGENLTLIAARYGVNAWDIARANGLRNLNFVWVGQRLVIPGTAPAPKPTPAPAPAPSRSVTTGLWQGEFFRGMEPEGGPVFVKNTNAINYHWGLGSPDPRLCCDEFSARWTRKINFRGGVYRFKLTVDDGARLWVDEKLVLDAWEIQPETAHIFDVTLTPGHHVITIEYFEKEETATIQFSFERIGNAPPPESAPTGDVHWQGTYYPNPNLTEPAVKTAAQPDIAFDWGTAAPFPEVPADEFSVRWTRLVGFEEGTYAICARADDGVRLWVDEELFIDEWEISDGSVTYCRDRFLSGELHSLRVEYFEAGAKALVKVWWEKK